MTVPSRNAVSSAEELAEPLDAAPLDEERHEVGDPRLLPVLGVLTHGRGDHGLGNSRRETTGEATGDVGERGLDVEMPDGTVPADRVS